MYLVVFIDKCTSPRCQVTQSTKFCTVAPKICRSPVGNVFNVTLLALRNLRWLIHFWKICRPQCLFTSRNGILRFEENLTHQGCVCVCVRAYVCGWVSVFCSLCLLQLFFRGAVF